MAGTVAYIMIKVELGKAEYVAQEAVKVDGIEWAAVVTGPCDVIAAAKTSSNEALFGLVAGDLQCIEGVVGAETALMGSWHQSSTRGIHPIP